jgi:hypothetical protein
VNFLRVLEGFGIFILGLYASWTVIIGSGIGDIVQLSKHANAISHKAVEPNRYWVTIIFWRSPRQC